MNTNHTEHLTSSFDIVRRITGDKWKFLIICSLINGPRRYGELLYHIASITKKVLTENLRELEELGIIDRISYPGNTLKVVYQLTDLGQSLQPILNELIIWSLQYSQKKRKQLVDLEVSDTTT